MHAIIQTMEDQDVSLGEYIRRLRRAADKSLYALSGETNISYSHLSRIENDSTIPGPDTIAKLGTALNGDLKLMLEKADCLPRAILDRIISREELPDSVSLARAASSRQESEPGKGLEVAGVNEAENVLELARQIMQLKPDQRSAMAKLISTLQEQGSEPDG
jgi:transcriptional regulator with XRE-family HTH domain